MKAKKGFITREVCGETVLLATGEENIDFTNIISLNETAKFLWEKASCQEAFTVDNMVCWLTDEYEVGEEEALADCRELVEQWAEAGILEGDDVPVVSRRETIASATQPEEKPQKKEKKGFFSKLFKG